jgi:hypothetical protein
MRGGYDGKLNGAAAPVAQGRPTSTLSLPFGNVKSAQTDRATWPLTTYPRAERPWHMRVEQCALTTRHVHAIDTDNAQQ